MRIRVFLAVLYVGSLSVYSQDSVYARQVIKFLSSKHCFGRGYLHNGLSRAASYISKELKAQQVIPLFSTGYYQPFYFNVNTFPNQMSVKVNGKKLEVGKDYILSPESRGLKGKFELLKKDSLNYLPVDPSIPLKISLKKKLTYSVSRQTGDYCEVQLLNKNNFQIQNVEVNIKNKLLLNFQNNNICGYINGIKNNDTMLVLSAHYDHLGGLGSKSYFPGANDNASGVSMLLNLIRYFHKNPPKYKTLFLFFAGEEAGLMGSSYFVENKSIDLKKIKFLINLDLLGTGDDGIMVVNGAIFDQQLNKLRQVNAEKNLVKEIKTRGKAQNSDHYWFTQAGVPSFFIYTLGGITAYHDVYDIEKTLPLTDYNDIFKLIVGFEEKL